MAGGPPFYCPVLGKDRRRGNDRLGAGDYHGSRRRLRHSISAVGTETPSTKRRPLGPLSPADKINAERNVNPDLLIGIVALIIAAGLFVTALPNKYGESPKFLQSYAAPMVYPAAVLIFLALGVAEFISWATTMWW